MEEDERDKSTTRKKYPDLKGEIISLVLESSLSSTPPLSSSSSSSLPQHRVGLHLAGHKDLSHMSTYVVGVEVGSLAQKDGRIQVGDELLEVNGLVITGRSHLNSSAIIKSIDGPRLALVIHRCPEAMQNMAVVPMKTSPIDMLQRDLRQSVSTPSMPCSSNINNNNEKEKIVHKSKNNGSLHGKQHQQQQQHDEKLTTTVSLPMSMISSEFETKMPLTHPSTDSRQDGTCIDPLLQQNGRPRNSHPELSREVFPILKNHIGGEAAIVKNECSNEKSSLPPPVNIAMSSQRARDVVAFNDVDKLMLSNNVVATSIGDEAVNGESRNAASRQCSSILPHSDSLASTDIPFDNEDDDDDDDTSDDLLNHHHDEILSLLPHHHVYHHIASNQTTDALIGGEENSSKTCPIEAGGKPVLIEIDRNNLPIGVILIGGQDTIMKNLCIKEILKDGAVEVDGRLQLGDEILEINGENIEHLPPSKVQQLMQKSPNTLRLRVKRETKHFDPPSLLSERFFYDSFTVEVFRKLGKGLGICLKSKMGDRGVVVSQIIRGGPAEADGRLLVGDEITTVNGEEVIQVEVLEIFEKFKTMTGRISLRVIRLKRSLSVGLQGGSSPSDHSLIGNFRKSFKRSRDGNHK